MLSLEAWLSCRRDILCTTGDIDLLIATDLENEACCFYCVGVTRPISASRNSSPRTLLNIWWFGLLDEVTVDLMAKASGIDYAEASKSVVIRELDGVSNSVCLT